MEGTVNPPFELLSENSPRVSNHLSRRETTRVYQVSPNAAADPLAATLGFQTFVEDELRPSDGDPDDILSLSLSDGETDVFVPPVELRSFSAVDVTDSIALMTQSNRDFLKSGRLEVTTAITKQTINNNNYAHDHKTGIRNK